MHFDLDGTQAIALEGVELCLTVKNKKPLKFQCKDFFLIFMSKSVKLDCSVVNARTTAESSSISCKFFHPHNVGL